MGKKFPILTILTICAGLVVFYIFMFSGGEKTDRLISEEIGSIGQNDLSTSDEFYNVQELHFDHMPITYQIKNNAAYCNQIQLNHMALGINIVENLSAGMVRFKEVSNNADISIECISPLIQEQKIETLKQEATVCKNIYFNYSVTSINWYVSGILNRDNQQFISSRTLERDKNHTIYELCYANISENTALGQEIEKSSVIIPNSEVMGDATPEINGQIIFGGKINLYQEGEGFSRCSFPAKEIHELFHIFGFDHTPEPYFDPYDGFIVNNASDVALLRDIMRPHLDCSQLKEINSKYLSCLKKIYSNNNLVNESCNGVNFIY